MATLGVTALDSDISDFPSQDDLSVNKVVVDDGRNSVASNGKFFEALTPSDTLGVFAAFEYRPNQKPKRAKER